MLKNRFFTDSNRLIYYYDKIMNCNNESKFLRNIANGNISERYIGWNRFDSN